MVSLKDSKVNQNNFIKADELFEGNIQFSIDGISEPKETFFPGRKEPSLTCEVEITILASNEKRTVGMSWNIYRQNVARHFHDGGASIAPVVLVKIPSNNGNPAWGFADPTDNLRDANAEQVTPF